MDFEKEYGKGGDRESLFDSLKFDRSFTNDVTDHSPNHSSSRGHSHGHSHDHDDEEEEGGWDAKLVSFVVIGILTSLYVVIELGVGLWLHSLVLLSDGFHNLSDVISLYIAYWAQSALKRGSSDDMSYGWARTEILGGLTNGCILLSLCLYVILESIPKFIQPEPMEGGIYFMSVAGGGLIVNLIGTLTFLFTGHGHTHAGGGGGHSHSHGGHSHGSGKKEKEGGHSHSHSSGKKEKEGGHSHSHSHESGKKEKGHSHDSKRLSTFEIEETKQESHMDMNVKAVFLHYLGDTVSSLLVLIAGLLLFLSDKEGWDGKWSSYIDPVSSLIIVALILFTTIPLVKRCSMILLQSTPDNIDMEDIRQQILSIEGVSGIHDFHLWLLVDGMTITSLHLIVEEGPEFSGIVQQVKSIFHKSGIHSSTIQPEFVPKSTAEAAPYCMENCLPECSEDWCCKKTKKTHQKKLSQFRIDSEL